MNIVISIDSLKGSLSSLEAGRAISEGIKAALPDSKTIIRPLADGGEGTVEALTTGMDGKITKVNVSGPLGEIVSAQYGIIEKNKIAVIEMAEAAGLTLVAVESRNPLITTTFGVGEIICDAIKKGCRDFIIGIGGSATNDGGTGMLSALGYDFLDEDGNKIKLGAIGLEKLKYINSDNVIPELSECKFQIACDVTNPLCGENGCSSIYGPQKGAKKGDIEKMDKWLENYAEITKSFNPEANMNMEGAGAAGGLGFAFLAYTNAVLKPGIDIVLEATELEEYIKESDIVVTGEGRLDSQTVMGKAPIGVAKLAKKYGKKVIALAGSVADDAKICNEHGIDAIFSIQRGPISLDDAMNRDIAYKNMEECANQIFRLLK